MSDGEWLEVDEVGFEHHPDAAAWMEDAGCERARVSAATVVDGHRWALLECAAGDDAVRLRILVRGEDALREDESPAWLEALARFQSAGG